MTYLEKILRWCRGSKDKINLEEVDAFFNAQLQAEQAFFYQNIETLFELGVLNQDTVALTFLCNRELNMFHNKGLLVKNTITMLHINRDPQELIYMLIEMFELTTMNIDIFYNNMIVHNNASFCFPEPDKRQNFMVKLRQLSESENVNEEVCTKLIWQYCLNKTPFHREPESASYDDSTLVSSSYTLLGELDSTNRNGFFSPSSLAPSSLTQSNYGEGVFSMGQSSQAHFPSPGDPTEFHP